VTRTPGGVQSKWTDIFKEKNSMTQTDPNNVEQRPNYQEELQVMGEQLVSKVKELIHEGNVRRIIIKQEGHTIMEIPLTVGVVSVIVAPVLAAIGAIGALIAQCSIEVIRTERPTSGSNEPPAAL
jgi:hypothetical protein